MTPQVPAWRRSGRSRRDPPPPARSGHPGRPAPGTARPARHRTAQLRQHERERPPGICPRGRRHSGKADPAKCAADEPLRPAARTSRLRARIHAGNTSSAHGEILMPTSSTATSTPSGWADLHRWANSVLRLHYGGYELPGCWPRHTHAIWGICAAVRDVPRLRRLGCSSRRPLAPVWPSPISRQTDRYHAITPPHRLRVTSVTPTCCASESTAPSTSSLPLGRHY